MSFINLAYSFEQKSLRDEINNLIQNKPKHFCRMIFRNDKLKNWVENKCDPNCLTDITKIYTALTGESILCSCGSGKTRYLYSIYSKLGGCGKANVCSATKQSVSDNCKIAAKSWDKKEAARKREVTCERINGDGIKNNGQTPKAIASRKATYSNPIKVLSAVAKGKASNMKIRGVDNAMKDPLVKATSEQSTFKKFGVTNIAFLHYSENTREILFNKEKFIEFIIGKNCKQIAQDLDISTGTVFKYHEKYDLDILVKVKSYYELEIKNWLLSLNINTFKQCDRKQLYPKELDFYFSYKKVAIEFQGDYYHMNPEFFESDDINEKTGELAKDVWMRDLYKQFSCGLKGIKLLQIWENDWNNNKDYIKGEILKNIC